MKFDMEEMLKRTLCCDEEVSSELNQKLMREIRKEQNMKDRRLFGRLRTPRMAVAIGLCLAFCTITGYAAVRFFTPSEVAEEIGDKTLAKAFESEDAIFINETQSFKDFKVTLLGLVSGNNLQDYMQNSGKSNEREYELGEGSESISAGFYGGDVKETNVENDKSYAVVAVERTDGKPMDNDSNLVDLYASPYIEGEKPWEVNCHTLGGGFSAVIKNGIQYRIVECSNVEIFADRTVYLGVSDGNIYNSEALIYDDKEGTLRRNDEYDGINALFTLPFDKKKADAKRAEQVLKEIYDMWEADEDVNAEASDEGEEVSADSEALSKDELSKNWRLISDSVKVVEPDKNKMVNYSYEAKSGRSISDSVAMKALFPDNKTGISDMQNFSSSDKSDEWVEIYELLENGKVKVCIYERK